MLRTLAIANYRSLRQLIVPLGRLNLITGPQRQRQVESLRRGKGQPI